MGRLLATEYALHAVLAYDRAGTFLGALGGGQDGFRPTERCAPGPQRRYFDRPHMCQAIPDGDLIIADTWNHRLQRFTRDGRFVGYLGGGVRGWRDDAGVTAPSRSDVGFHAPVAIGVAADGLLVVTDWGNNRLQWFDFEGRHVATDDDLDLHKPYDAQVFGGRCVIANSHRAMVLIKHTLPRPKVR